MWNSEYYVRQWKANVMKLAIAMAEPDNIEDDDAKDTLEQYRQQKMGFTHNWLYVTNTWPRRLWSILGYDWYAYVDYMVDYAELNNMFFPGRGRDTLCQGYPGKMPLIACKLMKEHPELNFMFTKGITHPFVEAAHKNTILMEVRVRRSWMPTIYSALEKIVPAIQLTGYPEYEEVVKKYAFAMIHEAMENRRIYAPIKWIPDDPKIIDELLYRDEAILNGAAS